MADNDFMSIDEKESHSIDDIIGKTTQDLKTHRNHIADARIILNSIVRIIGDDFSDEENPSEVKNASIQFLENILLENGLLNEESITGNFERFEELVDEALIKKGMLAPNYKKIGHKIIGDAYMKMDKPHLAIKPYAEVGLHELAAEANIKAAKLDAQDNLTNAIISSRKEKYSEAMSNYLAAEKIFIELNESYQAADCVLNAAKEYHLMHSAVNEKLIDRVKSYAFNDEKNKNVILESIGDFYFALELYEKASEHFQTAGNQIVRFRTNSRCFSCHF